MIRTETIWHAYVQQQVFREVLTSCAQPGVTCDLTRCTGTADARRAVLATLMDGTTTLADPHGRILAQDWPLLQARRSPIGDARYVVVDGRQAPDFEPALGSLESPEFGATLLIEVAALGDGPLTLQLAGPGIDGSRELRITGLQVDWLLRRAAWVMNFPLGVDIFLLDATRVAALPRTTRVTICSGAN